MALPPSWALLCRAAAAAALKPQKGGTGTTPGVVGRNQKPATKVTRPRLCGGSVPEMRGASGLKLESFNVNVSFFKAGQGNAQVSGHPGPLPGLSKLVSL